MSPLRYTKVIYLFGKPRSVVIMPEKLKGGVACLCCARPLSKWQFCFINRQACGFIRSLLYVCNRGDTLECQDGLRKEARSIPFARSAASNWNHTWQPVLDVFLTTQVSDRSHCAVHGGRSLVCLFWTSFQGLHYPQGLGQPHGPRHL